MKLECSSDKLKSVLIKLEKITTKNTSLPILGSVLLIFEKNNLVVRATNLSLGAEISIPSKSNEDGMLAVNGEILNGILANIWKIENVFLEEKNGNLLLKTKNNSILVKTYTADDFPTLPKITENPFKINTKSFIDGLKAVYYSSATSDIKPEFSSVYFHSDNDSIVFVSTDSFRLAEKRIKTSEFLNIPGILIPTKNVSEIIRILSDIQGDIKICFNKNQISIFSENLHITSKTIDGNFPDYKQIIPKEFSTEATVLKEDLLNSLKISNLFSDKFNQINIEVKPKDKVFQINSKNLDIGENNTNIESSMNGENIELSINYKYIIDCFQSIGSDSINLRFNGQNKPMTIKGTTDNSFIYLIMPMNK